MKVDFIWIGKEKHPYLTKGIQMYHNRLQHYTKSKIITIKDTKYPNQEDQKKSEAKLFERYLGSQSFNVCLDEHGKNLSSLEFANKIQQFQNRGITHMTMMIGGAYGFDKGILNQSDFKLSLSRMTLPHDLCRLILLEQVYRAFTILKNEKYHNP